MQMLTFCSSLPPVVSLSVSYRGVCGATACMDAAATRYLGSRSPESWKDERHPTPPPHPPPDTPSWLPCRGRTWFSHIQALLSPGLYLRQPLQGPGVDFNHTSSGLQPLLVTSQISAGTQCVSEEEKSSLGWKVTQKWIKCNFDSLVYFLW